MKLTIYKPQTELKKIYIYNYASYSIYKLVLLSFDDFRWVVEGQGHGHGQGHIRRGLFGLAVGGGPIRGISFV